MSEERMKILKMLEEGKITVEEATRLIEAIESPAPPEGESGGKPGFLRVRVWEDGQEKVKINVPLSLARVVMRAIPGPARQQMDAQGIDLEQILNEISDLKIGKLVEIEDGGNRVEVVIE
jgi:hypothetical protein